MLQSVGDVRQGFICPECHQDMSSIEMLQIHFEDVHMKQSSSTVKGLFSLAKQKIKSVQDNFNVLPTEQPNNYSQFFSFDPNDLSLNRPIQMGLNCSYTDKFHKFRKEKHDQTSMETIRLLLRLEQLTSTDENVPKNANTKERRKFEQEIVDWIDDSKVSLCPSCAKTFGLSRRKHHCRLDGFVICNQCSQFLPFSTARYLIDAQTSTLNKAPTNGVALQRSNSLTSLTSNVGGDDLGVSHNEDYLRICLSCRQILQRRYDQLSFKNAEKDEVFVCYEKIVEARNELARIHPNYSAVIESLLSGDTEHQIADGQRLYRRLTTYYEKIDSISKYVGQLGESCPNIDEDDTASQIRYSALCRNIRMYGIHLLQNYAISTRRIPREEEIQHAREERKRLIDERNESERAAKAELASRIPVTDSPVKPKAQVSGWRPTIDRNLLVQTEELDPLVQQIYQVTEYIRQAQIAGRYDEVESLKMNLKVLEQAMKTNEEQDNPLLWNS